MVADIYEAILQELGQLLQIELHPDKNRSCLLKLKEGVEVQIELDRKGEYLIVGSDIAEVPPSGSYRENLFREALRANGFPSPRYGIFAYSQHSNRLVLFEKMSIKNLRAELVADLLSPFAAKAKVWKEAIARGEVPFLAERGSKGKPQGLFGL